MAGTAAKIGLPPTGQALAVVNGVYDRDYYSQRACKPGGCGTAEDHGVAPHELCFTHRTPKQKRKRSLYGDPELNVFSSFNGVDDSDAADIKFVGISQTTLSSPFQGNGHLSMVAAGVSRIFNTGSGNIEPGDLVAWRHEEKNKTRIPGLPGTKIYPCIYALKRRNYCRQLKDLKDKVNTADIGQIQEMIKLAYDEAVETERCAKNVIGTALSGAGPGASFDILVRYGK